MGAKTKSGPRKTTTDKYFFLMVKYLTGYVYGYVVLDIVGTSPVYTSTSTLEVFGRGVFRFQGK